MPNVGIIAWPLDDEKKTGVSFYVENIVKHLVSFGYDENLLLVRAKESEKYVKREVAIPSAKTKFGRGFQRLFLVPYMLNHSNIDVVYFPYYYPMLSGAVFYTRKRKVLTIHDLVPMLYPETQPSMLEARMWTKTLEKSINSFCKITTVSEHTKDDVIKYFGLSGDKIDVVYPGYNPIFRKIYDETDRDKMRAQLEEKFNISTPFILFVGTLEPRKNVVRIIKAFSILKKQHYPQKLVLVGKKGWKYDDIFQTIEHLQLEDDVLWTGYSSLEDMVALYNLADVFVFPSLYEGFGSPPLEAMACGTPVVTSNISSLPEVVGEAGLLVDPYDEHEIAEALTRIIDDKEFCELLCQKGIERSSRFSWSLTAAKTWQILNSCINSDKM